MATESLWNPVSCLRQGWKDQPFYLWKTVWDVPLSFILEGAVYLFFCPNSFRDARSSRHVSIQWLQPRMPASCRLDELLTAAAISWLENVECGVRMLHICYPAAVRGFVWERQASPAISSQRLPRCLPWKPVIWKEGVALCWHQPCVWLLLMSGRSEKAGVLRWALDWNAGGRSRVYLLPASRFLAHRASACTLRLERRRGFLGIPLDWQR